MNESTVDRSYETQVKGGSLERYTTKTFGWMFAGPLVTFIVAVGFATTEAILYIYSLRYWPLALLTAELGIMIYLSARIEKVSVGTARGLLFLCAALNGIVLSAYLFAFGLEVLWMVFGITALFFEIMALISWFSNINFTKLRLFMLGGLVFLFFYWIFTTFIDLSAFGTIVSTVGILLSLVLTAYDAKKIQAFHTYRSQAPETVAEASISSALQLYLNFIDLFMYIMRIPGYRK